MTPAASSACHAAQGDGEVGSTAVETSLRVLERIGLSKRVPVSRRPRAEPRPPAPSGGTYVTMGVGPDLLLAAADAIREMIDHLVAE